MDTNVRRRGRASAFRRAGWLAVMAMALSAVAFPGIVSAHSAQVSCTNGQAAIVISATTSNGSQVYITTGAPNPGGTPVYGPVGDGSYNVAPGTYYIAWTNFVSSTNPETLVVPACPQSTPVDITLWKYICPTYSVIPANKNPTNLDATGGHGGELSTKYGTTMVNPATDVPEGCTPLPGWQFTLTNPNTSAVIATPSTGTNGSVVVHLTGANADLVVHSAINVTETVQSGYDFGALRCYTDIANGDNLEAIFGWNGTDPIACIAYNLLTPGPSPSPNASPSPSPTPPVIPCTAANNCFFNTPAPSPSPSPSPSLVPSPSPSLVPSPSPSPQASVEAATSTPKPTGVVHAATGKPHVTPPPTDTLGLPAGQPASDAWRIALLGLAALLASLLILTERATSPERRRR